jgi:hypothetical protein
MPYLKLEVGELQTNTYLFYSVISRRCFIIDPGAEAGKIISLIQREKLDPLAVILVQPRNCSVTFIFPFVFTKLMKQPCVRKLTAK